MNLEQLLDDQLAEMNSKLDMGEHASAVHVEASPTALCIDRWGMRRGEKLAESEWNQESKHDHITLADCHAALFEPNPELAENPEDQNKSRWFSQLMETPDYHGLHAQTMLDAFVSELAAKSIADSLAEYMATKEPKEKDEPPKDDGDGESIKDEMNRIRSVGKAIESAKEECEAASDFAAGLGEGVAGSPLDRDAIARSFRRIRDDQQLQKIFKMAGRFRRCASALQRQKTRHGIDDTVGVKLDGTVRSMMQSELASLVMPQLKLDTMRRIAEKQVLCRDHRGFMPVAKGPVVVVVDESGSMSGKKIIAAKALALTMGWVAKQQKRWIVLVGYSGGSGSHSICCPPRKWNQDRVIDWLEHFFGAGSSLDVPIGEMPDEYWPAYIKQGLPRGKTDLVFITDAVVNCPEKLAKRFIKWKAEENVKTYGIVVGQEEPGDFATLCDRLWCVKNVDLDEDAVQSMLSI